MNTATALGLLGTMASLELQRRYIVGGTVDAYLDPGEPLNDVDSFLDHPLLGESASLESVRRLTTVFQESLPHLGVDDIGITNEELVERHPYWVALREAARAVLDEMGADLEAWEREQLA